MSEANKIQIDGDHYKVDGEGEEHWDRQWRLNGRGYFTGSITKYVERYPEKNGLRDLKKARHFLDKLIELETEAGMRGAQEPELSTMAGDAGPGYVNQD